ncbi:MAG: diguanylate cyclase [Clostridia bacterium]|nr:diguanylate cyclase [Clostridia bacterium]
MIIFLLILTSLALVVVSVLYFLQSNKIAYYKTLSKNMSAMSVVQNMFGILGSSISATKKIEELNNTIMEAYSPKYSTISIFDGSDYEIKSTNVEDIYKDIIADIAEESDFKANATKNISKYLTTSMDKTLTYKSAIERKIRSCMFSPIYYDGTYLGFWLLEDEAENAFDFISKDELLKLKNNMGVFIENTQYQNIIENAENRDKQTGLYNSLYLYSVARQYLSATENSSFILLCLKNLPEINENYGRNYGNILLIKFTNILKEIISNDSIHIRYSGTKFLVICPNTDTKSMHSVVERLLSTVKNEIEYVNEEQVKLDIQIIIHDFKKQNSIEKEVQKMIVYIENMKDVNTIKVI